LSLKRRPVIKRDGTEPKALAFGRTKRIQLFAQQEEAQGESTMKKISFALVGAASLALAAGGGKGDDSLGDNVNDNYEAAADNLEAAADNTGNAAAAATLENQADALEAEGDRKEEAIDEADVNASNSAEAGAAVNAM
jgi:hypothetical protein